MAASGTTVPLLGCSARTSATRGPTSARALAGASLISRNTESCALKSWPPRGSAARKGDEMAFLMFVVAAALTFAAATGFFAGKLVGMEQARREESEE